VGGGGGGAVGGTAGEQREGGRVGEREGDGEKRRRKKKKKAVSPPNPNLFGEVKGKGLEITTGARARGVMEKQESTGGAIAMTLGGGGIRPVKRKVKRSSAGSKRKNAIEASKGAV